MPERFWPTLTFIALLAILAYVSFQATLFYAVTNAWVGQAQSIATTSGGVGFLGRNITLRASLANPDFNYEACVFDLRSGPYLLKGPDVKEYWSITVFDRQGEAMFGANGPGGKDAGPYLVYAGQAPGPAPAGSPKILQVPQAQGIVVFRLLANRSGRKPLSDVQDELRCEPYRPTN